MLIFNTKNANTKRLHSILSERQAHFKKFLEMFFSSQFKDYSNE